MMKSVENRARRAPLPASRLLLLPQTKWSKLPAHAEVGAPAVFLDLPETNGDALAMARDAGMTPAELRVAVTSPGGTTAAALQVLMAPDGLAPLMERAIAAAKRRAGELSG